MPASGYTWKTLAILRPLRPEIMHSSPYTLHRGTRPLLISFPHVGTELPAPYRDRLVVRAHALEDTDWHVDRLFDFARAMGASLIVPRLSRYVIDLNRPPDNQPMYPGQNNTELCPTRFFSGDPLYRTGCEPGAAEIEDRVARFWQPYHQALRSELERLRDQHGRAVLFDAHSIRGELPWLFEGRLPDMNIGTASGSSCGAALRAAVESVFAAQDRYTWVLDGRFKGGYITRKYGEPQQNIHAIQLEMSWRAYMLEAPPYAWHAERAQALQPLLTRLLDTLASGSAP